MRLLAALLTQLLHGALLLAVAPLLPVLIRRIRARLTGRVGPPLLLGWRDLLRLSRKQPVVAAGASWLFVSAPYVAFAAVLAAALLVPSFALGMASAPMADLLLIVGLLALARCTMALAAMDTGTAFGALGAGREMMFATFADPALLLTLLTLSLVAGTTNVDAIATVLQDPAVGLRVSLGLALIAMVAVALTENGRLPAGNPSTHLELTMVREALVLEYSGRHLALIEATEALKLLLWMTLLVTVFVPFGVAAAGAGPPAWALGLVAWAAKLLVLAAALAVLEVSVVRMRLFRVPEFLGVAVLLGLLAAVFLFVSGGFA